MASSDQENRNKRSPQRPRSSSNWWLAVAGFLIIVGIGAGQQPSTEETIRQLLNEQVAAWNRGDIEGYMKGYWDSDSTVFTSGGTVTRGYDTVLSRYEKSYDSREKMGELQFRDLTVEPLSSAIVVAAGIWELKHKTDHLCGRFTLIIQKKPEGWRITHDHTSLAQK
jgi:beta-aspartyl-peptidase (threonine type)